jgi:hypothetical protein
VHGKGGIDLQTSRLSSGQVLTMDKSVVAWVAKGKFIDSEFERDPLTLLVFHGSPSDPERFAKVASLHVKNVNLGLVKESIRVSVLEIDTKSPFHLPLADHVGFLVTLDLETSLVATSLFAHQNSDCASAVRLGTSRRSSW